MDVIEKAVAILMVALIFPIVMITFNAINTTGFTVTQIAITTLMGVIAAIVFVRMIAKE